MKITKYPKVDEVIQNLLFEIQKVLKDKLVGVYIYGSLVWGDFDENVSDIDLLAAIKTSITDAEFQELRIIHDNLVNKFKDWNDRIEVQYLSLDALETFKDKESEVITISPGEPLEKRMVGKHWLMNWYMVREKGLTLIGPDPKTIIEPITKDEFIHSVKGHVENWNEWVKGMDSKGSQAYAILTLCRALYAYKNGNQVSKTQAAEWVQKELPQYSELIQNALIWRKTSKRDKQEDNESYPKTEEFVMFVREQIINT